MFASTATTPGLQTLPRTITRLRTRSLIGATVTTSPAPTATVAAASLVSDSTVRSRPVAGLHAYAVRVLKPFIAGLYLHGSLATLDYACDYSDFDTLIVQDADRRRAAGSPCDKLRGQHVADRWREDTGW